jgi:dihydropteroate synthase
LFLIFMDGGVAVLPGLSSDRCQVMGILNVTPDSFSDGGRYIQVRAAIEQGLQLVAEGADVIDVGGESTRPGATPVSVMEEIDRVVPVIAALSEAVSVPISVDTSKPEVMRSAVAAGACMINDVRALRLPDALETAAGLGVPVCLMHMQGEPATMQCNAHYKSDVVGEVMDFLAQRLAACKAAGLDEQKLMIDPGFGFGKELPHNLALLAGLDRLKTLNQPILVGVSRKTMLGQILGQRPAAGRQAASVAAALWAAAHGAAMVRVHDVAATVDALRVWQALAAIRAR